MPLPSSTINPYNFSNQYAASADIAQGAAQLANQTARLGASISASITENNQRKEAQALAPQLAATYQQGFKDILGGNPAGGLASIYGASMQASTNPFLARMADSANTAANWATNNYLKSQMEGAQGNSQMAMFNARNQEYDRRQGMANEEWDRRHANAGQPTAKHLTSQYNTYWSNRDRLMKDLSEARDSNDATEVARLRDRILEQDALAVNNGLQITRGDGTQFLTKEAADKLGAARKQFQELTASGVTGPEVDRVIRQYNDLMNGVKAQGEELLQEKIKQFGSQRPLDDLPTDSGADIIPIAGNQPLQGTPAQQAMQAEDQAPSFNSVQEAESAGLPKGTEIIIGGRRAVIE